MHIVTFPAQHVPAGSGDEQAAADADDRQRDSKQRQHIAANQY